jgi:proteasome assembly chaperone (PAC2) family protein
MEMMDEFTGELVEAVEVTVEVIAAVVRPDETTVTKPLENPVDRIAVVVAPVGDLGDSLGLVEIVEHLEGLAGQQLGEIDVGVLADEVLIAFDGASIRRGDSFSAAIAFRVDEPQLDERDIVVVPGDHQRDEEPVCYRRPPAFPNVRAELHLSSLDQLYTLIVIKYGTVASRTPVVGVPQSTHPSS